MTIEKKRATLLLLLPLVVLMIPFIAMQLTDDVNWSVLDFVVAGILLFSCSLGIELLIRKVKEKRYRILAILLVLAVIVLLWAELAVGIFGTPLAGS